MHPFDHLPNTPVIVGDSSNWAEEINLNYLDVCHDKTVLEIASGPGVIGQKILKNGPKELTMIDPAPSAAFIKGAKFIQDDINLWLSEPRPMDVVVCFGFLYHTHSSLHLLESIVNYCDPEIIILDNVVAPHPLSFNDESLNRLGNRYVRSKWKHCPYNLITPFFIINKSLDHMGYNLIKTHKLKCDGSFKSNSWVASWKKKSDNQI